MSRVIILFCVIGIVIAVGGFGLIIWLVHQKKQQNHGAMYSYPYPSSEEYISSSSTLALPRRGSVWEDTVLLLTCTVNPHRVMDCVAQTDPREREATYRNSLLLWLTHSPFRLIIVENSGFPMSASWLGLSETLVSSRVQFVLFDESKDKEAIAVGLPRLPSKGAHELFAINRAMTESPVLYQAPFVIKITGRFFIPKFLEALQQRQPDVTKAVAVRQADAHRCQVVGCATPYSHLLFAMDKHLLVPNPTVILESVLARRLEEPWVKPHLVVLPPLPIAPTKSGGMRSTIHVL
jgi:hypothetical protein